MVSCTPEIINMKKKEELLYCMAHSALVIHAHPFREDPHNDYIRWFPRQVHGVEIVNASRSDDVNEMARLYAEHYGLLPFVGSDNHSGIKSYPVPDIMEDGKYYSDHNAVVAIIEL